MAGNTLPGVDPSSPFGEGLGLDGLLTLIALGLVVIHGAGRHGPPQRADWPAGRGTDGPTAMRRRHLWWD
jgi:hypothetical protein